MGLVGLGAVSVTSDWIELQTLAKVGWGGLDWTQFLRNTPEWIGQHRMTA